MGLTRSILKNMDMFGHPPKVNYNKEGATHKTVLSGLFSLMLKITITVYLYIRLTKLFSQGEGDINASQDMLLPEDIREIEFNYTDIGFMLTPGIRTVTGGKKAINVITDMEVRKYIEITFVQMFQDLENPDVDKRGERYRYIDAKICDHSDYNENEETKALYEFNQRRRRLYYCPDISKGLRKISKDENVEIDMKLNVKGTVYDKTISQMHFTVYRCDNTSLTRAPDDPPCADIDDIDTYIKGLEIETVVVNKQLDYEKFGDEPTFISQSTLGSSLLHESKATSYDLYLQYNEVALQDDLVQMGQKEYYNFLNYKNVRKKEQYQASNDNTNQLYNIKVQMSQIGRLHSRRVFGIFDLLGELGGVSFVLFGICQFILSPMNEFSFTFSAAQKLFYGRTLDHDLFDRGLDRKTQRFVDSEGLSARQKDEIQSHRRIKLSMVTYVQLFYAKICCGSLLSKKSARSIDCCCLTERYRKLIRLIDKAGNKMQDELNIVNIIKNNRNTLFMEQRSKFNIRTKFLVEHSQKNIINLETSTDEEGGDTDEIEEEKWLGQIEEYICLKSVDERFRSRFGIRVLQNEEEHQDVLRLKHYKQDRQAEIRHELKLKMNSFMKTIESTIENQRNLSPNRMLRTKDDFRSQGTFDSISQNRDATLYNPYHKSLTQNNGVSNGVSTGASNNLKSGGVSNGVNSGGVKSGGVRSGPLRATQGYSDEDTPGIDDLADLADDKVDSLYQEYSNILNGKNGNDNDIMNTYSAQVNTNGNLMMPMAPTEESNFGDNDIFRPLKKKTTKESRSKKRLKTKVEQEVSDIERERLAKSKTNGVIQRRQTLDDDQHKQKLKSANSNGALNKSLTQQQLARRLTQIEAGMNDIQQNVVNQQIKE